MNLEDKMKTYFQLREELEEETIFVESIEEVDEDTTHFHFKADDANNKVSANKFAAKMKKRGIEAKRTAGAGHYHTVTIRSKNPSHHAFAKNSVKKRYDVSHRPG